MWNNSIVIFRIHFTNSTFLFLRSVFVYVCISHYFSSAAVATAEFEKIK